MRQLDKTHLDKRSNTVEEETYDVHLCTLRYFTPICMDRDLACNTTYYAVYFNLSFFLVW